MRRKDLYQKILDMLNSVKGIDELEKLDIKGRHLLKFQKDRYFIFFEIVKIFENNLPAIIIDIFDKDAVVDLRIIRPAGKKPKYWEVFHDLDLLEKISEKELDEILKSVKEILDRIIPMLILKEI